MWTISALDLSVRGEVVPKLTRANVRSAVSVIDPIRSVEELRKLAR